MASVYHAVDLVNSSLGAMMTVHARRKLFMIVPVSEKRIASFTSIGYAIADSAYEKLCLFTIIYLVKRNIIRLAKGDGYQ